MRTSPIPYSSIQTWPVGVVGVRYLISYVLLDWISFIEPYAGLNITPWNPGAGLGFVLVLLFGARAIPFLFVAPLLVGLIPSPLPLPLTIALPIAVVNGGGYAIALLALLRPATGFDPRLSSMRDLMLLGIAATLSATFVALCTVGVIVAVGLLPMADFGAATLRYWVGDMIGIAVVAPFGLIALTRRRMLRASWETALQLAAILAALALVFGYAREQQFQLFYVLFLPIIWMAVRGGSEGVVVGVLVTQIGLILGVSVFPGQGHDLTAYQALMLVLAITALVAGELVSEHRRTASQLRLQQESLSRLARLGSMGEFAAAIAHELNQPLMAAGTYTRLVNDAIAAPNADTAAIAETARKAVAQVERAADVVSRLRALVRLDRSNRAPCSVADIVKETVALCQPDLDQIDGHVDVRLDDRLPDVMVDMLQIEQALLNLLRNSIAAVGGTAQRSITVAASLPGPDFVEVRVSDTGPGFPADRLDNPFLPLSSTKAEGLGFGLPLCKSIIEAHGGRLWLGDNANGAAVHFTLPVAATSSHD